MQLPIPRQANEGGLRKTPADREYALLCSFFRLPRQTALDILACSWSDIGGLSKSNGFPQIITLKTEVTSH